MSKYYTPTIEEFHVGFEYEWNKGELYWKGVEYHLSFKEDNWNKAVFDISDAHVVHRLSYGIENVVRVKHLDREDIESFGFVQESLASFVNKDSWYIEWMPEDTLDIYCVSDCRFKGKIKKQIRT